MHLKSSLEAVPVWQDANKLLIIGQGYTLQAKGQCQLIIHTRLDDIYFTHSSKNSQPQQEMMYKGR